MPDVGCDWVGWRTMPQETRKSWHVGVCITTRAGKEWSMKYAGCGFGCCIEDVEMYGSIERRKEVETVWGQESAILGRLGMASAGDSWNKSLCGSVNGAGNNDGKMVVIDARNRLGCGWCKSCFCWLWTTMTAVRSRSRRSRRWSIIVVFGWCCDLFKIPERLIHTYVLRTSILF